MSRCAFIKAGGERCKGIATAGATLCYSHDPARADERSRNARKAGRAGGNGRSSGLSETAEARRWIKSLVAELLEGKVERDVATAAFMGLNTLGRFIELERKLEEAAVREEFEELKRELHQLGITA